MTHTKAATVLTLLTLAACSSTPSVPPGFHYASYPPPMKLIEGPSVPPPANDIPESERIAWLDSHRPRSEPTRIVVREHEPQRHDDGADWGWAIPLTLSLGYWSGHGHDDHGWGWGVGWNSGWWW
jgi:hypothetical protein